MNQVDINEKISAWLEPKPAEPAGIFDPSILAVTPKGAWKFNFTEWVWQSLDYFHSEDANARLRDAMILRVNTPESLELCGEDWWITLQRNIYDRINRRVDINDNVGELYREQMVLAFCKFAGIETS